MLLVYPISSQLQEPAQISLVKGHPFSIQVSLEPAVEFLLPVLLPVQVLFRFGAGVSLEHPFQFMAAGVGFLW